MSRVWSPVLGGPGAGPGHLLQPRHLPEVRLQPLDTRGQTLLAVRQEPPVRISVQTIDIGARPTWSHLF